MPLSPRLLLVLRRFSLLSALFVLSGRSAAATLSEELETLAEKFQFEIVGTEFIEDEPAIATEGSLYERLKDLLFEYNHIVLRAPNHGVKKIIVLGRKQPAPEMPPDTEQTGDATDDKSEIPTQRQGAHHLITATLVGPSGQQLSQTLMVDTGASFVVLPQSKGAALGFDLFRLPEQKVQTAKGEHAARVGVLKALTLGEETVNDVQVAFIEDSLVGTTALLGMNVLSRFRITIDDERNVLTLDPPPEKPDAAKE